MPHTDEESRNHSPTRRLGSRIAAIIACRIVLNTGRRFIYPFAPDLSRVLGVPLTSITGLIALNSATNLLGLISGPLADRFGYRAMMILGMAALAAGMAAVGFFPAFAVLVVAHFLSGLGKSIYDPAVQAYISERVPYGRRGRVVGFLETAWAGSTLLGVPLLALLVDQAGWRAAFFSLSASGLLGLALMIRLIPADRHPGPGVHPRMELQQLLTAMLHHRAARGIALCAFLFNAAMDNLFVIYGAWFEDAFQLSVLALGAGTSVIGAAELLGEFITVGLGDRLGLKRMAVGGVALCVLTYLLLPAVAVLMGILLGPRKPNAVKGSTYECGIETVGDTWIQFRASYYIFALIFVVFDVEAVFLFPWAVAYQQMQLYMVLEGVLFLLILAAGLLYAWRKGALEWV